MNNNQLLESINATLRSQLKVLCCKLDSLIEASGGTVTPYNVIYSQVVPPGEEYTSPEAHTIQIMVIGTPGEVLDISINGNVSQWPVGVNWNQEATTVFETGMVIIQDTSTATAIVTATTNL